MRCSAVLLIVTAVCLAACGITDISNADFEASETFSFTVPIETRTGLRLVGINGPIEIDGDPAADSILIEGERKVRSESIADAEQSLTRLEVRTSRRPNDLVVQTVQPSNTGGRVYEVEYRVVVPGGFNLVIENTNGAVDIRFVTGAVSVTNVNGAVDLFELTGDVAVELVNGQITADVMPAAMPAIALRTVNGRVELDVPATIGALLVARIVNGNITVTNLDLTNVAQNARMLQATVGDGRGRIDLETVNGDVRVLGR